MQAQSTRQAHTERSKNHPELHRCFPSSSNFIDGDGVIDARRSRTDGGPDTATRSRSDIPDQRSTSCLNCKAWGFATLDPKPQTRAPSPPKTVARLSMRFEPKWPLLWLLCSSCSSYWSWWSWWLWWWWVGEWRLVGQGLHHTSFTCTIHPHSTSASFLWVFSFCFPCAFDVRILLSPLGLDVAVRAATVLSVLQPARAISRRFACRHEVCVEEACTCQVWCSRERMCPGEHVRFTSL